MISRTLLIFALAVGTLIAIPVTAEEADVVGSVKNLEGDVTILRGGEAIDADVGTRIHAQDTLITGEEASLGIVLRDDTTVSLGPDSELKMKEFEFEPSESSFSMVLNMVKGTFVYVSGRIAKLAPGSVEVETPVGVVAVRGTKFLASIPE